MNTDAQTVVSLTADQVRERLTALAQRAFKSAANDAELELLITITTSAPMTFSLQNNIWEAVLRHHNYEPVPFDDINDDIPHHYRDEARRVFDHLVALHNGEDVDDELPLYPEPAKDYLASSILKRGGELLNFACETSYINKQSLFEALDGYGFTTVRGHFASEWLYHPADLGVALASHGFGKDVHNLRGISSAILSAVEKCEKTSSEEVKKAQAGIIALLWPLLKGAIFVAAVQDNGTAMTIVGSDETLELIEDALERGLQVGYLHMELAYHSAQSEGGIATQTTETSELLRQLRARARREQSHSRDPWD